jgi:hypothetical protein
MVFAVFHACVQAVIVNIGQGLEACFREVFK